MEFFVVVLIFITCMIALALLIYYCQEKRNPKYSFTSNQQAIGAIALSVGAPAGIPPGFFKSTSPYVPTVVPYPPQQSRIGFEKYVQPPLDPEEEMSDSGSSTSSKIYFTPNTAAYSVAKRLSTTAKMERQMSIKPKSYIHAEAAAYLLARKLRESIKGVNSSPARNETIVDPSRLPSSTSRNQNMSDSSDSDEKYRSNSYIPAPVVGFNIKNKSRSVSPYVPLYNEVPSAPPMECNNLKQAGHERSPLRSESLPPQKTENGPQKQSVMPKRSGSLPPKQSETVALMQGESTYSERFPFAHSEVEYRSHSPTPLQQLHTVEEEMSE